MEEEGPNVTRVPDLDAVPSLPEIAQWRLGETPWRPTALARGPRPRIIVDNDFSGDPDDLFQLVHHLLSPTVDIRGVIASHLRPGDVLDSGPDTAANAALVAKGVFRRLGLASEEIIFQGSSHQLEDMKTPRESKAVEFIIREALRDTESPLVFAAGGGLTDLASAILVEPKIIDRIRLIWIGGEEHPGLAYPPADAMPIEYNLLIDVNAARVVFDSGIKIWQVPRNIYRQCLVSETELRRRVASVGPVGDYLYQETKYVMDLHGMEAPVPNTYALGDSPLVLLTALLSTFEPDSSSSDYVLCPTPQITETGGYRQVADRPAMRVYTRVDNRLMFEDMFETLAEFCEWQARVLSEHSHLNGKNSADSLGG